MNWLDFYGSFSIEEKRFVNDLNEFKMMKEKNKKQQNGKKEKVNEGQSQMENNR